MAHSFFEQLCEHLNEGVLICDSEGQVLHANRVAQARFSKNLDWLSSRPLDTWLRGRDGSLWPSSRESVEREARFEDATGDLCSCRVHLSPLPIMGSRGWLVVLRDELSVAHRLAGLESLVGGIAQKLSRELEVVLESASKALLASEAGTDRETTVALRNILEAGQNAAMIKRQLCALTGERADPMPISLNAFVSDTAPLMDSLLGEPTHLRFQLDPQDLWIQADPSALRLAMVQLSEWIASRSPTPPSQLVVATHRSAEKPDHICLTLTENDSNAEPLIRVAPEMLMGPNSLHYGFAIVFGIVEQLDGRMLVHSGTDGSQNIHLEFPECPAELQHDPSHRLARGSETILVVDDDPSTIEVVSQLLQDQGYTVITATNGTEASAMIQKQHQDIDVLLTDAVLPGRSGLELIADMRAASPKVPVLLMSGYPAEFMGGQIQPDIPMLGKPFSPGTLIDRLRTLIESR
ncbi:MAG: response regulator [Myxococcota bacterium]|nr:response regulator [Myxococcota bacterium]